MAEITRRDYETRFGGPRANPRNPGGRPPQPIRAALMRKADGEALDKIVEVALSQAQAGDAQARQWVADRLEGKAVARNESGDVGDYDIPLAAIREKLRIVPKRR
jgi:hypothetical protein